MDPPAQMLRGEDVDVPSSVSGDVVHRGTSREEAGRLSPEENEIWRVEASVGRAAKSGVYDVIRVPVTSGMTGIWRLLRVAD
jgi:hypothetical protein